MVLAAGGEKKDKKDDGEANMETGKTETAAS